MEKSKSQLMKNEEFSSNVEVVNTKMDKINYDVTEILRGSNEIVSTIGNTLISLKQLEVNIKQLEYSYNVMMKNAEVNLEKITFAKTNLESISKRMDKLTDQLISIDLNTNDTNLIEFRTQLLNSINKQTDQIGVMLIGVFNC